MQQINETVINFYLIHFFHLQLIEKGLCLLKTNSFLVQGILSAFRRKS